MFVCYSIGLLTVGLSFTYAIPPAACYAKFRWDDCGKPPVPVIYYWKPGSRCEVGVWRGCLPNMNMFSDEYECVATCIYTSRAAPSDYHVLNAPDDITEVEDVAETTTVNSTEATTAAAVNATEGGLTTVSGGGGGGGANETATNANVETTAAVV